MRNLILTLFVMSASLFAAGDKGEEKPVIGITQFHVGLTGYLTAYADTFTEAAEQLEDVDVIILDAAGDVARQTSQIQDLILQEVSVIIVWPTNGHAIVPAVKQAYEKGIPVVITNSKLAPEGEQYMTSFSGPDDVKHGEYAARMINEAFNGQGKVVQITGSPGYAASMERQQGFERELAKIAPGITLLDTQPGDWNREKAQRIMENFLTKYPEIDGVFAANDDMGIGALNAAKSVDRDSGMSFVGATNDAAGYDAIARGEYYASIYQSPIEDAKNALDTAMKILRGEPVPKYNFFETYPVTKENYKEFERPVF